MQIQTPYYYVDETLLIQNLEILQDVMKKTGCKILLAQKAFGMFSLYPLIRRYLCGTTASGLYEARLGAQKFGGETHVFSPAYTEGEFDEIASICGHVVFNSLRQLRQFKEKALQKGVSVGVRVNPMCSTQDHAIYDPCAIGSRLGMPKAQVDQMDENDWQGVQGLHFHTLCEQNADALQVTLQAVEEQFGAYFGRLKWLNFGGGHHITRADYDRQLLISEICRIQNTYGLQVYLEPGEAVVLNTGFLVCRVVDLVQNGMEIAILDTSAACHMPDVLEMPYRPPLLGSGLPNQKAYTYRLAGPTCLAGDVIGDYSFDKPLQIGDELVFGDMAHYSMVKNNTFNGMALPSIAIKRQNGQLELVKAFGYEDFVGRLS